MGSISGTDLSQAPVASIPIVDLAPFSSPSSTAEERRVAAEELVKACRDVGFVYIQNHGVSEAELDRAFRVSNKFYNLPQEEKMKAPHPPGWAVHRGYSWPGLEKVSNVLSKADDEGSVKQLREVQDFKVCILRRNTIGEMKSDRLIVSHRKAMRSDRNTTRTSQMYGLQTMSCLSGDRS